MTEFNDVVFALSLQPSAWLNVPVKFLGELDSNPSLFKKIATSAPSSLKYMGKDMLMQYGVNYSGAIGAAILRDPEVIDVLDDNFFKKNHPKFIFNKPKSYVINILGSRLDKFPTLAQYLNCHLNAINKNERQEFNDRLIETINIMKN